MKKYEVVDGISFPEDTDCDIARTICEAIETKKRVLVRYKKGYEDFTGYTKDGINVHMYIGKSNGTIKIPLHIVSSRSTGGTALSCELIESIKIK